jgi:replicative DNA helicase
MTGVRVVSVAEFPSQQGPGEFTRTPPQDIVAEQSVLGGMLLSKDAIADVVEAVRGHDFYRPAHELVYEAILDLYGRGEPADAVTVSAELSKRGELTRIGGGPYLHTLISSVPTAANAGYYARIVRETAILRRLIEAGTKIVQMGYNGDGEADDIVDAAQAEVYNVTDRRTSEDYLPLSAIMEGTLDEIEAIGSRGGEMVGVPTGFADFDELTNGLHPGQMIVLAARPAVGKALALDTALPTPHGWTTMGQVMVGDRLVGADGRPTTVIAVTDVLTDRSCYEVEFSDGTVIVADAAHQWLTSAVASRTSANLANIGLANTGLTNMGLANTGLTNTGLTNIGLADVGPVNIRGGDQSAPSATTSVKTTEEIARTLRTGGYHDRRFNHTVALCDPLDLPLQDLPLPPYALGVWTAQRHGRELDVSEHAVGVDDEVALYLDAELSCLPAGRVGEVISDLGVAGAAHLPASYLRAAVSQRRALLAGLLDAAGAVRPTTGCVQLSLTDKALALDVRELVVSLGYACSLRAHRSLVGGGSTTTTHLLAFRTEDDVFWVGRKRARHAERRGARPGPPPARYIVAVRPVASVPVRCVEVDNESHLYLAGPTMIPTHNSTLGLDIARSAAIKANMPTCVFSLEMSRNEITMRLLSAEARVPLHHMRTGKLTDDDWTRLARRMGEVSNAPLFIDDSPNMSMMEIRAKCRRLKQRHGLKLVVIDYLQLMQSGKRVESRQQEVSEFSRALKLLAKELEVPVVAISQLNRASEQRTDKKPMMSDLRESGSIEQDADMVVLLHREELYERESPRAGEADFIVAKHRNGPTATITVAFQGHYSRFVDMAQS